MGLEIEMACNGCERRIQLDDALYCPECQEKAQNSCSYTAEEDIKTGDAVEVNPKTGKLRRRR